MAASLLPTDEQIFWVSGLWHRIIRLLGTNVLKEDGTVLHPETLLPSKH